MCLVLCILNTLKLILSLMKCFCYLVSYLILRSKSSLSKIFNLIEIFVSIYKENLYIIFLIFQIRVRFWKTSQKTLRILSEDFLGTLLMCFMLEDFGKSSEVLCAKWYKFWICILCVLYIRF